MDLTYSASEKAFRAEARDWLARNAPSGLPSVDTKEGFFEHVAWEKDLFAAGWAVVSWPEAYGGRGASLNEWLIFEEEYHRCGAPRRVTQNGIFLLAPTLFEHGTDAQKARILKPMAGAEVLWGQAWSEPNAGSDLASLKSRAEKVDGGWRLTGAKTWCTRGAWCDRAYGLFRSDPALPRHRGLTYFMFDLSAPGVTVRPVRKLDGDEGFAEVFLDDVFVSDEDVIGEPHKGWYVAMSTASSERGLTLRSPAWFLASSERLVELYKERGADADPGLRDKVVQAWMDAQAYDLLTHQAVARMQDGQALGATASLFKLWWSELDIRIHEAALGLLGPAAELEKGSPDAVDGGAWLEGFQFALAGPIYAGTNEIQRNVVAERLLGLPKR